MPVVPRWRAPRLLAVVAALASVVALLGPAPAARAEDPLAAGDTVVGQLVRAWPEHEDPAKAVTTPLTWVRTEDGSAVRIPTGSVRQLALGATVAVTVGAEVTDAATKDDGLDPARQVLRAQVVAPAPAPASPAPAAAPITNAVTVVLAVPLGGVRDSTTLQQVVDQVNGPVADFWSGQSGGAIRVGVTAQYDWFPLSVDCSDPYALWSEAAQHAGWTGGAGQHLMVYLPKNTPGCAYGLAEVGSSPTSGGELYVSDVATSVMAHELGHNFGLNHSSERQCDNTVDTGVCRTVSYGDWYDVMGASWQQLGSLSVGQAARIGLLPPTQQQAIAWPGPGTAVTLTPVSSPTGIRALKLVDPAGRVFWVEYRPAAGQDAWLATTANWPDLDAGVLLRQETTGWSDSSMLLDGTPSDEADWSADRQTALPIARAVSFDYGMFSLTLMSWTPTEATVQVATGPSRQFWTASTNRLPWANWDGLQALGTTVSLGGWAFDPDSPTWRGTVHVYVDGHGTALAVDGSRPDVGRAFPGVGDAHGFSWSGQVAPGVHQVCLFAIDDELPGRNSFLGCRLIAVGLALPQASWDGLQASGTTVSVGGWAFDPDSPSTSTAVHVYVDGHGTPLVANGSRPDVGRAFPGVGDAHGFSWSGQVAPGVHQVCVFAIDDEMPDRNSFLGCRQLRV